MTAAQVLAVARLALDHPWISKFPNRFVQGTAKELAEPNSGDEDRHCQLCQIDVYIQILADPGNSGQHDVDREGGQGDQQTTVNDNGGGICSHDPERKIYRCYGGLLR